MIAKKDDAAGEKLAEITKDAADFVEQTLAADVAVPGDQVVASKVPFHPIRCGRDSGDGLPGAPVELLLNFEPDDDASNEDASNEDASKDKPDTATPSLAEQVDSREAARVAAYIEKVVADDLQRRVHGTAESVGYGDFAILLRHWTHADKFRRRYRRPTTRGRPGRPTPGGRRVEKARPTHPFTAKRRRAAAQYPIASFEGIRDRRPRRIGGPRSRQRCIEPRRPGPRRPGPRRPGPHRRRPTKRRRTPTQRLHRPAVARRRRPLAYPRLSGYIDLLWQDADGRWHILDYKATKQVTTRSDIQELQRKYGSQLFAYRRALEGWLQANPAAGTLGRVGLWLAPAGQPMWLDIDAVERPRRDGREHA